MRFSWISAGTLALGITFSAACGGGDEGCRPNPSVTADMAALNLPAADGGKLCHAEAKFVMYEVPKDRTQVLTENSGKLEKAGWKEIPNPATGKTDSSSSLFFEKNGKQIMYTISKCHRSFLSDLSGSCSIVTFDDVTK